MDPIVNKVWVNTLLPLAIILLGFGLDIKVVFSDHIGFVGLVTIATSIITAFTCTMLLSRAFGIDRIEAFALGAGGAICGNSAVLAVAPSLRLSTKQTGSILAVVNILGLATFLSVPIMARVIGLHTDAAGIWAGATVHAVPQAIAAGEAMGGDALVLASGTKADQGAGLITRRTISSHLFIKGRRNRWKHFESSLEDPYVSSWVHCSIRSLVLSTA